ncbi:MAG: iron chaperone [Bacteroidia bacterium]
MNQEKPKDIDSFIATFPKETQKLLQQVRETIQKAAPDAIEKINYGIPTFDLKGNLVHFSGYKNHIGFYPGGGGIKAFEKEISNYKNAKGSVQFPIDQPMPLELISKITKFRVVQNLEKAEAKKKK